MPHSNIAMSFKDHFSNDYLLCKQKIGNSWDQVPIVPTIFVSEKKIFTEFVIRFQRRDLIVENLHIVLAVLHALHSTGTRRGDIHRFFAFVHLPKFKIKTGNFAKISKKVQNPTAEKNSSAPNKNYKIMPSASKKSPQKIPNIKFLLRVLCGVNIRIFDLAAAPLLTLIDQQIILYVIIIGVAPENMFFFPALAASFLGVIHG
jgi:hypothetical protein